MKNIILTTIVTLAIIGTASMGFAEPRTIKFLGVTYTVPESNYEAVSSETVSKQELVRSKFLGATVIVPEQTLAPTPVNEVRKKDPIRSKFLGVTESIEK